MTDLPAQWPEHFSPEVVQGAPSSNSLSSICIALEAWRRGLKVRFLSGDLHKYAISQGKHEVRFNCALPTSITKREDTLRLRRKAVANDILEKHGLPVPRAVLLDAREISKKEVKRRAKAIGYPLVLKPNTGSVGRGVIVNLNSFDELWRGFEYLVNTLKINAIVLESYHTGNDYRVLVIGDEVVAACHRKPANVIGDGTSTIRGLITAKNKKRRANPFLGKGKIKIDHEVENCLREQELTVASVVARNQPVYLRKVANASAGGDVVDVTDELPTEVKRAAIAAVKAMPNIEISGVDILYDSDSGEFVIIEMNRRPHIAVNMYPSIGVGRDVPHAFINHFFPESARSEQPDDQIFRFNLEHVRKALITRTSNSVSVAPLAQHRFPVRRNYVFANGGGMKELTAQQEMSLLKIASRHRLSGSVRKRRDHIEMFVAARDEELIEPLEQVATELFGHGEAETPHNLTSLTTGFTVDQRLVVAN